MTHEFRLLLFVVDVLGIYFTMRVHSRANTPIVYGVLFYFVYSTTGDLFQLTLNPYEYSWLTRFFVEPLQSLVLRAGLSISAAATLVHAHVVHV
jgi:hypothetical protein